MSCYKNDMRAPGDAMPMHSDAAVQAMVLWMFSMSILLGSFVTGMTPLVFQASHYTISWTRVCMAWHMASWMGVIEVAMSARMSRGWQRVHTRLLLWLGASVGASLLLLRTQLLVTQASWATRMVEHHSTAVLTSSRLVHVCGADSNPQDALCSLASSIVSNQQTEIAELLDHAPVTQVSLMTAGATLLAIVPVAGYAWNRLGQH